MKTLILSGYGTNCEKETALACRRAAPERATAEGVEVRHISEIYRGGAQERIDLEAYHFLVLVGGFLDGDDLGSARACANRFRYWRLPEGDTFLDRLRGFVEAGRLVLGICNGFQLLVKLGLLPGLPDAAGAQQVTLAANRSGHFEDRWVHLVADGDSPAVFTRGLERLELPVRHGEGRLAARRDGFIPGLVAGHLAPLRYATTDGEPTTAYPRNPNGSQMGVAALCNPRGTVMGLMPHPEAYTERTHHPRWTRQPGLPAEGQGLLLFRNAYRYLSRSGIAAA